MKTFYLFSFILNISHLANECITTYGKSVLHARSAFSERFDLLHSSANNLRLDVKEDYEFSIIAQPNPTSGILFFDNINEPHSYEVLSVYGMILKYGTIEYAKTIDISILDPGVYLIKLIDQDTAKSQVFKIIKI